MLSRPFLTRIPDDTLIAESAMGSHLAGTRDEAGRYAMIYAPAGGKFKVRTKCLSGDRLSAAWFDPRNGEISSIGTVANLGELEFEAPGADRRQDWVLILDVVDRLQ